MRTKVEKNVRCQNEMKVINLKAKKNLYNIISKRIWFSVFAYGRRKGGKNRPWCLALASPSVVVMWTYIVLVITADLPIVRICLPFFLSLYLPLFVLQTLSSFTHILTHLSSEVFQDSRTVYRSCSTDSTVTCGSVFQMPMNSTDRKLKKKEEANVLRMI